jgi:hypothetical protein
MMRNAIPNTASHALRGLCTAMNPLLYRACAAMKTGIAVQERSMLTGVCKTCTAVCRVLLHARTHAGAHVRTQESSSAQWDVSRYTAVHAVQTHPRWSPSHPVHVLTRSHPFGPRWPTGRDGGKPRCCGQAPRPLAACWRASAVRYYAAEAIAAGHANQSPRDTDFLSRAELAPPAVAADQQGESA